MGNEYFLLLIGNVSEISENFDVGRLGNVSNDFHIFPPIRVRLYYLIVAIWGKKKISMLWNAYALIFISNSFIHPKMQIIYFLITNLLWLYFCYCKSFSVQY